MPGNTPPRIVAADEAGLDRAAQTLRGGGLVAVPTETVYGLAARADSAEAVAAIYRAKGRPDFNPLIVHVADVMAGRRLARFDARAEALAAAFWPGPLTLVLPLRPDAGLAAAVTAGLETVAVRCPAHPVMRALLAMTGLPLAAPSANASGSVSPTSADHVAASLGERLDLIVDGGLCATGLESSIVALRDDCWQMLRPGPVSESELTAVLAGPPLPVASAKIEAPGQLAVHYSPGKPVRLAAKDAAADEFFIGFGELTGDFNLSSVGDLTEAACRLYEALHRAGMSDRRRVAVAMIPSDGIGAAINDRLRRAATRA